MDHIAGQTESPFRSFLMGGFESSAMARAIAEQRARFWGAAAASAG